MMPDGCVDMILADLPYGTTACKWDTVIPFDPMWKEFHRIAKPNAAIVLTASQPFTSVLVASNLETFKYCLVWDKKKAGNFAQSGFMPMKVHEDVCVFVKKGKPTYNPQKTINPNGVLKVKNGAKNRKDRAEAGGMALDVKYSKNYEADKLLPTTIISISKDNYGKNIFHPTQKPVALFEYLIKTYTNEGDLVFDPTAGSLTTAVAAENLQRRWAVCEMLEEYFDKGVARFS